MRIVVVALVSLGVAFAVGIGLQSGLGPMGAVLLVATVAVGVLAVAVARRAAAGMFGPSRCVRCSGVVSRHAPYCKHCGASLSDLS